MRLSLINAMSEIMCKAVTMIGESWADERVVRHITDRKSQNRNLPSHKIILILLNRTEAMAAISQIGKAVAENCIILRATLPT